MRNREIGRHSSLARVTLSLLCGYSFLLRGVRTKVLPSARRMRALREDFYVTMWRSSAKAVGARFNALPDGTAEIQSSGRLIKVRANVTSLDDDATLERAGDKLLVYGLLARFGIPVPRHIVIGVGEFEKALHMLRSSAVPLVVKPAANTGAGAGVSTNVLTPQQLRAAVAWARAYGSRILVEEQMEGDCYRVLLMDGEVLDTVVRHPPTVIGDQLSTVRQLVRHENKLRREEGIARAQVLIRLDPDLRNTLSSQGLNLDSRPAKGEVVVLKRVINDNGTRENAPAKRTVAFPLPFSIRHARP